MRSPLLVLAGTVLTLVGVGAYRLFAGRGASSGSGSSPTPGPKDPPLNVSAGEAAAHKAARPILIEAITRVLGRAPTLAELQYSHGVAWLETNYGKGWQGAMASANNWGAVSCNPKTMSADACEPGQTDHFPDGTAYQTGFRRYPSPVDGAADEVANILKQRPATFAALHSSAPSFYRASFAMRREKYYGGFCPKATAQYGQDATRNSFQTPDANAATRACSEECVAEHAGIAYRNARAVAQSLGEPLSMPLGTFADAAAWWVSRQGGIA